MPNVRMSRINAEIQKHVAGIIDKKLSHPNLSGVLITVLHVDTTPDILQCTISVSVYGGDDKVVIDTLNAARSYVRFELGKQMRLRTVPELKFVLDTTYQYSQHMNDLFESIR